MFELFGNLISQKKYFDAGHLLAGLGSILTPAKDDRPAGFSNAQVHIVPLDDVLHVFMVLDESEDFNALPGDPVECNDHDSLRLLSKRIQLGELHAPQYPYGALLHFLHVHDAQREVIHAAS